MGDWIVTKNVKDDFFGYSLNYLSLNLLPNFYFVQSRTTVFLGASGAGLLFYKVINDYPKSGQYFNSLDFNLIVGVNQEILTFDHIRIDIDTRFNLGLSDIRAAYWLNETRNYGCSIGILIKKVLKKSK